MRVVDLAVRTAFRMPPFANGWKVWWHGCFTGYAPAPAWGREHLAQQDEAEQELDISILKEVPSKNF